MTPFNWLNTPLADALGWTLIHAIWQGFAVVFVAALLLHLTRRRQAWVRYRVGMGGLLAQLLASAITFGWQYEPELAVAAGGTSQPMVVTLPAMAPVSESWLLTTQALLTAHLTEVVWVWLLGVTVFGLRLIGGWAYLQRLTTTATLTVPALLADTTARIAEKLQVSASLRVSARVSGPLVVGVLKPIILWPVGLLAGLSVAEVEAVLAHELAHVRRHDYLLNMIQSVVDVLFFFHPALWWLSARVREEREHCCDDLAVSVVGDARILARALARVEAWQRETTATPTLAMAFASKRQLLLQRVQRMLGMPTRPLVSTGNLAGLTLLTILLLSVSAYAVQQSQPKPAQRTVRPKATKQVRQQPTRQTTGSESTTELNEAVDVPDAPELPEAVEVVQEIQVDGKWLPTGENDKRTQADAKAAIQDTSRFRVVQQELAKLTKQMQDIIAERQPLVDQMSKEMAGLSFKYTAYHKQLEPIMKRLSTLTQKLNPVTRDIQRLAQQDTPNAKVLLKKKEAEANRLEKQIQELGEQMENVTKKLEFSDDQQKSNQDRMGILADSISKLYEPTEALAEQIGVLSEQLSEQAEQQATEAMEKAEEAMRALDMDRGNVPARRVRPPRPPIPALAPAPPRPSGRLKWVRPPVPAVAPKPPRPAYAVPAPAPKPNPAPRPAKAPKG